MGVCRGGISNITLTSSSEYTRAYSPSTAVLRIVPDVGISGTGWIPTDEDLNPWLQLKMKEQFVIRALVTQGCGDQEAWVTELCISYLGKNEEFIYYDGQSLDKCKV